MSISNLVANSLRTCVDWGVLKRSGIARVKGCQVGSGGGE